MSDDADDHHGEHGRKEDQRAIDAAAADLWQAEQCRQQQADLFRERLDAIIDMRRGLVRLAGLMPWSDFDESFGKFFKPTGRPAKPTRLMVGLHYLKHVYSRELKRLRTYLGRVF